MASLIVVYATTDGHTRTIAERIGEWVRDAGHSVSVVDSQSALPGLLEEGEHEAAIFCSPVHQGEHSRAFVDLIRENRKELEGIPSALVSVSLSAALPDPKYQEEARSYVKKLLEEAGWHPQMTAYVGGALLYSQYDFMKRLMVRLIASSRHGETDSSRDWDFTDWDALHDFVVRFLSLLKT